MIPIRLNIRNFLSYRENVPTLDFSGVHVACLCGANGHGKSALLDAITWCLWGRARGRTQDDLISYGADEVRVELEFLARDASHRVIRSHLRGGGRRRQGASDLQLQALDGGQAQPIGGNSIRETQARIDQLVGMDYDTFINSAFLLQGRADEFTSKTPSQRKEVLGKVLGLSHYDQLQERARARLAETRTAVERTAGILEQLQREVESIGDPAAELAGLATYLGQVEQQLELQRTKTANLAHLVAELEAGRSQLADLEKQKEGLAQDISQLGVTIAASQGRVQEYQGLIQEAQSIEQGMAQLVEARRRFETQETARNSFVALESQRADLLQAVATKRARLEAQAEQFQRRVESELLPKAEEETNLLLELQDTQRRLESLSREEAELGAQRQRQQVVATGIGEANAAAEQHRLEGQELRKKLDLLSVDYGQTPVCPLCQTPLEMDRCQDLSETYQREIQRMRQLYQNNQAHLKTLEAEAASLQQRLPRQEQALARAQRDIQAKLTGLDLRIQESRQAQRDLDEARPRLEAATASLESGDFAAEEHRQIGLLDTEIGLLGYDEEARQQSYQDMEELRPVEERQRQLFEAQERLPEERDSLAQAQQMRQRRESELSRLEEQFRAAEIAVAELPERESQLRQSQAELMELESRRETALGRRSVLEHQSRRLAELQEEVSASRARQTALQEEVGVYQELVNSLGRQGVQAMLIETVVPRLEEEANLLLGRMTDNRIHVKLETQRERRTGPGEPIETLEINVSDELGPRSYEMYSGGEAFRVNLALRIALSKVLAQRTGAPLPTLFIDEGFGTQDTAGRERVLDVISAIEDDFDKIIVITHLDDLKDMFPVRIEVNKDANGSTFWLS